ncbi:uncharacterized protein LOC113760068 [Coffea eugenioides]|uniref:uncharacterized protein LOC113760068 n=2 Tax=Coffea eugenioides TaxID=49369 RepID=UPI000F611092|nr:uncharacterized protein LOC113760068 [Coffea eugenioides]
MGVCVTKMEAYDHLKVVGFIKGYNNWIAHRELSNYNEATSNSENTSTGVSNGTNDMQDLVHDVFEIPHGTNELNREGDIPVSEAEKFYKLIDDSQQDLYRGCKNFSKLSFIIRLLHLKCLGKMSNKIFNMLVELLREAFPEAMTNLPSSYYEAEKLMNTLGLGYEKIDACPNDCSLYWGSAEKRTSCETCNELRWVASENDPTGEKRKIPQKVLWHFPLKPRLQRLFMSSKIASQMRWHEEKRTKDGCMRHPADSPAWQTFDHLHPEFAKDCRNVRLGLASDGFNPFNNMSSTHSTWPVVLIPYNLPPWMCMKQPYFMLSLLIPGPSSPGNNIDVYLQPLVKELTELWDFGIQTYDASQKENFQLHAALLWTISDFPGYAMLSGWSTKDSKHKFRKQAQFFDGTEEHGKRPPLQTGDMIVSELGDLQIKFGKLVKGNPKLPFNWKKRSIFFDLPYWKDNVLRHNLDFMHIEKNVCENIWGTLLDIEDKAKDHYNSRRDLREMGIRKELHPIETEPGKVYLPPSSFAMDKKQKTMFCNVLKKVKVPDGYAANVSRCVRVKPPRISGLKSHDNHILMQQLMPIALRKTLPKSVRYPLIRLSRYFRQLCSKVICPQDVVRLESEIAVILCDLEKCFPPTFFDVMVHLVVHLATKVKLGGPVYYRWMYRIERPEGSIAQGYLAEECINFCSLYLADYVETKFNRPSRNEEVHKEIEDGLDIFSESGHPLERGKPTVFDAHIMSKAHQYILFNCDAVTPYIEQHRRLIEEGHPQIPQHLKERLHSENFACWFAEHIDKLELPQNVSVLRELRFLAKGPDVVGIQHDRYVVNGFRFHTKEVEKKRKTQNSGVTVNATTSSFASIRDQNPVLSELVYFGVLKNMIELIYGGRRVVLFECDWISNGSRMKQDADGFTLVNFANVRPHVEPFILASQASQVFYVEDPTDKDWQVVISTTARAGYNMGTTMDVETYLQSDVGNPVVENENEEISWVRKNGLGIEVDLSQYNLI